MKKIIIYSLIILFASACENGMEQYQSQIDSLNGQWNEVTTSLTTLTDLIQKNQTEWEKKLNNMSLTEEVRSRISDDHLQQLDSLKTVYADFGPQLQGMVSELQEFAGQIAEDQSQMEQLNAALKKGNRSADLTADIEEMEETVSGAKEKLDNWETTFSAVEEELTKVANERADLLQAVL